MLALLCLASWLPGLGRQEFVGTEDFRARIAVDTAAAASWPVPRYYGRPILTKPPLDLRLQAWSLAGHGADDPGAARRLSLAALAVTCLLLGYVGTRVGGPRAGLLAGCGYLLATNTLKNGANAEIDPLFALFVVAGVLAWWRACDPRGSKRFQLLAAGLVGAAGGLAGATKGWAVLPFLIAAGIAVRFAGRKPRLGVVALAILGTSLGSLWWPLELHGLATGELSGAVREGSDLFTAWNAERIVATFRFPLALLAAAFPFSLAALYRLRDGARHPLDRYLVAFCGFALLLLAMAANKATRYLLPCMPLLVLAGVLRLELHARSHTFVRGVAWFFLLGSGLAALSLRHQLTLPGMVTLLGLGVAAGLAAGWSERRPALALMFLLLPARALIPEVYVPIWEPSHSVASAVNDLLNWGQGVRKLAVFRLETPRLTDPLPAEKSFYWHLRDLHNAIEGDPGIDAILLDAPRPEFRARGFERVGTLHYDGRPLPFLRRVSRPAPPSGTELAPAGG